MSRKPKVGYGKGHSVLQSASLSGRCDLLVRPDPRGARAARDNNTEP